MNKKMTMGWLLPLMLACCGVPDVSAQRLGTVEALPQPLPNLHAAAESNAPATLNLDSLVRMSLDQNPRLQQAALEVEAAHGAAIQAGLCPNPMLSFSGEEIGRNGGIHTIPFVSQEIVTAGKLRLSRAAALKQVDQKNLELLYQRFNLIGDVRAGYYEVLAIQQRIQVLDQLLELAQQSYKNAQALQRGKQVAELDVLPFQIELERLRADREVADRELIAAWRRLTAIVGAPRLPQAHLTGSLEIGLPDYDLERASVLLGELHPAIQAAQAGIARAELTLRRAEVEPHPNITIGGGFSKNFNDRENQATYQVSIPLPLFDRNQGNIIKARAEVGQAFQEVQRVGNDLSKQLAEAYGRYAAARQRAERYQSTILPNATRSYELSLKAFQGGQFEYLRAIQSQQSLAQARLVYIQALGDAWRAAGEISGLLLEEHWPPVAGQQKAP